MEELINYHVLTWPYFLAILLISAVVVFAAHRFHVFSEYSWKTSIRYHMFFLLIAAIVLICFLLVSPVTHGVLMLIVGGIMHKNIVSYIRSIFSLYYSGVRMGDRIRLGNVSGVLTNINFGGIHILSNHHKVYFPFNQWKNDKIILESQEGRVPFYIECKDEQDRHSQQALEEIEKSLFLFPYLDPSELIINSSQGRIDITTGLANARYKDSLLNQIEKAGFKILTKN